MLGRGGGGKCGLAFTLMLALAPFLVAQDAATAAAAANDLATAKECFATGDADAGIVAAWRVLAAGKDADASTAAQQLLTANDPLDGERKRVRAAIAKAQVELARTYRTRKWFLAADEHLDLADRFDATAGKKEREQLTAQRDKPRPTQVAVREVEEAPRSAIHPRNRFLSSGPWRHVDGTLVVTAHDPQKDKANFFWRSSVEHADGEIVLEWQAPGTDDGNDIWLSFGESGSNTCDVIWSTSGDRTSEGLRFLQFVDRQQREIQAKILFPPTRLADGFHHLGVRIEGTKVTVSLDGHARFTCALDKPPRGKVGLVHGFTNVTSGQIVVRRLEVLPLSGTGPSEAELLAAAKERTAKAVDAAFGEAKDLMTAKQPERASLALRALPFRLRALEAGGKRDELRKSVAAMATQADPGQAKYEQATTACCKQLVALAEQYAKAGRQQAAQEVVRQAAAFDPDGRLTAAAAAAR